MDRITLYVIMMSYSMTAVYCDESAVATMDITAVSPRDALSQGRVHFIYEGTFQIKCACDKDKDDKLEIVTRKGQKLFTGKCELVTLPLDEIPFGEFTCRQGDNSGPKYFNYNFKLCTPQSHRCRQPCGGIEPRFCVQTENEPEGIACAIPPQDYNRGIFDPPDVYYCPGNHASLHEAVTRGLTKTEYVSTKPCNPDEAYAFLLNGERLHYYQSIVLRTTNVSFQIWCSKITKYHVVTTLHTMVYHGNSTMVNVVHQAYENECYEKATLLDAFENLDQYLPVRIHTVSHVGLNQYEYHIRFDYVFFMKDLQYSIRNQSDETVIDIKIPATVPPEFEMNLTAIWYMPGDKKQKLEITNNSVTVQRRGLVVLTLNQTYFRCVPHVIHRADTITKVIPLDDGIDPSSFGHFTFRQLTTKAVTSGCCLPGFRWITSSVIVSLAADKIFEIAIRFGLRICS